MNNYGIIYDIRKDKAVVLTQSSNFVMIHTREDMFLGQKIAFDDKDILKLKNNHYRYASIGTGLAAVCVLLLVFFRMIPANADIYAYVAVDINPSMEFCINKDYKVIEAVAFNDDAAKLIKDIKVIYRPIEDVIMEIIKGSKKHGYIMAEEKTDILISAALKDANKETGASNSSGPSNIDKLLDKIEKVIEVNNSNIDGRTARISLEEREVASELDISMGKYDLFLKLKEQGKDISIDEIDAMKVSDLIEAIGIEGYELSAQSGKEAEGVPVDVLTNEEISNSEQTPKNIATPTPVKSYLQNSDIKASSNPMPEFSSVITAQPKDDKLTNSSSKPTKGTSGESSVESKKVIKLKHYNEKQSVSSQAIRWDFVIENTGNEPIDLKNVKVRYYFKEDVDKTINFSVYFYSLGDEKTDVNGEVNNITRSDSTNRYLEVTFEKGSISPGESAWVFGAITREDWTEFNQKDDWSFNQGALTFSDWNKMTVYISDEIVWGIEPF